MKKTLSLVLSIVMLLSVMALAACGGSKTYEIAVVTDVGQLMDRASNRVPGRAQRHTLRLTASPTSIISPLTAPTRPTTTVSQQ